MSYFEKPKLYYFDIPGKAEAIRLASVYSGYAIEDIRISRDEMLAMRDAGKLTYGQLPALEIAEGVFLAQSAAIMRYLGKKNGLYPADDVAAAIVDGVIDEEIDLFTGFAVSRYQGRFGFGLLAEHHDLLRTVRQSLNDEVIPRHLGHLEALLEKSQTGWIAGTENPTIADFILVPRLKWIVSGEHEGISTDLLMPFPRIVAMMDKLMALPAVVTYYS